MTVGRPSLAAEADSFRFQQSAKTKICQEPLILKEVWKPQLYPKTKSP